MQKQSNLDKDEKIRLDKWLWAARFYKTRSLAITAIKQGKVLYGGQKTRPSREVHIGATITVPQGYLTKTVIVQSLSDRRGPATAAQALYTQTAQSIQENQEALAERKLKGAAYRTAPRPASRPNKHERKAIQKMRRFKGESD